MHITYCTECGARLTVESEEVKNLRCEDCIAGRSRKRGRHGDSAKLRRNTTSRILKKVKE